MRFLCSFSLGGKLTDFDISFSIRDKIVCLLVFKAKSERFTESVRI